ncbi:GNAT family N-acetyltransferase [Tenacibaculum sp. SG-28]|uniref:GNAT family N-acetyltransferase n=1 Tax=Tenacibaculum sp. SG-28 TaxID=754426 RepID=UPI000CF4C2A8|nr:GNAT family N-acetyltransferase [Tenacibaculum sp. SG-28]PQJ23344.1 GNAT family N-acetyltransferase [Tenacibaculum sp. SG-28]
MIQIREATLNDLPVLLEFEQALIKAERPFDATLKDEDIVYYNIKNMILATDVCILVATENKKLIASGYASIHQPKVYFKFSVLAYVGFMYVIPEKRGKGINKRIMDSLFDWIRSRGINEVRLDVYTENSQAIKAYEKVGFQKHLIKMRTTI